MKTNIIKDFAQFDEIIGEAVSGKCSIFYNNKKVDKRKFNTREYSFYDEEMEDIFDNNVTVTFLWKENSLYIYF